MSSLQIYERGAVFFGNQLLVECQSVSVNIDPKLNEINTMQKGFAGVSPGSEMVSIDVTEALPRAGIDYDAISALQGVEVVDFVLFAGDKKFKTKGFINNVKMNFGADRAAEFSFTFIGAPIEATDL
jgi:hypothetical protein